MTVLERLRARFAAARRQPGQVLIIFAIAAPTMIGAMGLGIDVGYIFKERRELQNVADMAALSGVSQLPDDKGAASTIAVQIAKANGVDASSVTTKPGYNGDENQLEVSLTRKVDLFFMPVLGFDNVTINARAVAEHTIGKGTAIFAKKDTHCWDQSIYWGGKNITIDGDAHSNSGVTIPTEATGNTLTGDLTHGIAPKGDVCNDQKVRQKGNNPNIPKAQPLAHQAWPVDFKPSDFPCTRQVPANISGDGPWWVNEKASSKILKPGVLCLNGAGTLTLTATGITGNVTFVAENIQLNLTSSTLTAYSNDVVAYSTGTRFPSMVLNVSGGTFTGMLYERAAGVNEGGNQGGQVEINGSNGFRLNGSVLSWAVRIMGSNWSIVNNVEGLSQPAHLVE